MAKRTKHKDLGKLGQGRDTQAQGLLGERERVAERRGATRVVSVPLGRVLPDRFQARIILPPQVKNKFFFGEIDCYQAAGAMLEGAQHDPGLRAQVDDLLSLGASILEEGQVEPGTGVWARTNDGRNYFLLEVGERRFWALALKAVEQELEQEPLLAVTEQNDQSRARQIAENLEREDITAVDLAKAIASLILLHLDVHPEPEVESELDYFRQVLEIKRLPSGTWPAVQRVVKHSRQHLQRHLDLLKLPDDLIYMAGLYRVPESVLREILPLPESEQRLALQAVIEQGWTAQDLEDARELEKSAKKPKAKKRPKPSPSAKMASRILSFMRLGGGQDEDRDYLEVAAEISAGLKDAQDLEVLAAALRRLADDIETVWRRRT